MAAATISSRSVEGNGREGGRTVLTDRVRSTVKLSNLYMPDPPSTPSFRSMASALAREGEGRELRTDEGRVLHQLGVRHRAESLIELVERANEYSSVRKGT
jgi:hypothetical protein